MTTDLTVQQGFSPTALPDESTFKHDMEAINRFQVIVKQNLLPEQDFGVIPGTGNKPTLLKPGAEKIAKLLGLSDQYIIVDRQEDWSKPFFRYLIKCQLISVRNGVIVSEGLGECNSYESKYRYRNAQRKCPICGVEAIIKGKEEYGGGWLCYKNKGGCGYKFTEDDPEIVDQEVGKVENEDIFSLVNTLLKMAKKRALVDASLSAGRLSNVFTQDLEDLKVRQEPAEFTRKPETKQSEKTTSRAKSAKAGELYPRNPDSIKSLGDLFATVIKDWPEKFAAKDDVLRFIGKKEADIVDPGTEYIIIATKLASAQ